MIIFVVVTITVSVLLLGIFVLLRSKSKMAAFVAWMVQSLASTIRTTITGAREETGTTLTDTTNSTSVARSRKPDSSKVRQRIKKPNEEPAFNTKLTTPIESILEETINEDLKTSASETSKGNSIKSKNKPSASVPKSTNSQQSGIKKKSKKDKPKNPEPSKEVKTTEKEQLEVFTEFVPVKDKRKAKSKGQFEKKDSQLGLKEVVAQSVKNRTDPSKPIVTEHFKKPIVPKTKFVNTVGNSHEFVFVSGLEEKLITIKQQQELKESKKVSSTISYASIVTNDFTEEVTKKTEESSLESLQKSDSSQLVAHDGIELLITGEFCDLKHNRDSSSIEVLSETTSDTQNTDYQNLHSTENTVLQEEKEEDFHEISNISDGFVKVFNVSENISVAEEALKYTEESSFNGFPPDINQKVPDIEGISPQLVFVCKEEAAEVFFKDFEAKAIVEEIDFKEESQPEKVSVILSEDQVFFVKEDTNFEVLSSPVEDEVKIVFEEANSSSEFLTQQVEVEEDSLLFESRHLTESTVQSGIGGSDTTIVDSLKGFIEQEKETSNESEDFVLKSKEKKTDSDTTEKNRVHSLDSKEEFFVHILKENGTDHHQQLNGSAIEEDLLKDFIVQEKETSDLNGYCVLKNIENKEDQSIKVETVATQVLHNNISETEENLIISEESKAEKNIDTSSQITEDIHIQTREKEDTDNTLYSTMSQVRILTLNDKEHQESTIYRIEKNWIIQFRLGPTLLGRKVNLYCNYPQENGGKLEEYDRCNYHLLSWCHDDGCKNADDTALFTQIQAELAGGFHYYFVYENGKNTERQGSGYFLVDPILKYGHGENLPLDCIQCQTVLAKGLGPFSTWEKKLQVAKESGYNMIHFTPLQELGASNSSYSLSEQLKLNPIFNEEENGGKPSFEDVEKLVCKLRKDWKISSICDIVLNHTANESEWLKTHPEVTYNCNNCPYMRPAYLLDAALHRFSMDVKKGLYEDRGIPAEVCSEEHLNAIRHHFKLSVLDQLKIYELFSVDTETLVREFLDLARKTAPVTKGNHPVTLEELTLLQDPEFRRLKTNVSMEIALKTYNVYRNDSFDEETRLRKCAEDFKRKLDYLNEKVLDEVNADLHAAMENVIAGIRYFRVQSDGPKFKEITANRPLVSRYFTDYGTPKNIKEHEDIMYSEHGTFLMAHNGWVMNSDPLKNFADPGSKIYIRRELIAWGDSVKLRYGDSPADCPFLWDHMRKYVELTAKIFDGVRLDNCHSTPLNVAEYLLDCARRVRPDLYVVAELFTNSDLTDNVFVNRLGITSLIREAMSAWDSHEEGRLVYRYGGVPVGSFYQPNIRPLVPTVAHALFMDLTHDNPSPVEKRCVFDMLPSTALVNMACCASGSNRGYDELVPHHIHVVDETRQYTEWTPDQSLAKSNARYVTKHSGIIAAKKAMNDLHFKLGKEGFNQVYVDQMDTDIVAVTRHNPETHESYILVAFTAFGHPDPNSDHHQRGIKPLRVEGVLDEIVFETSLSHINVKSGGSKFAKFEDFLQESKWINGLSEYQVSLKEHIQVEESDVFEKVTSESPNVTQVNFKHFKPGSAVVVKVSLPDDMKESVNRVRKLIKEQLSFNKNTELRQIIEKLKLSDLNRALYRCDQEERDEGYGFDVYNIPNFGPIVYAGLQGFMSLLANIRPNNDLGHPMCGNLRDGNWMLEYIWKRLKLDEGTKQLGQWIEENTKCFNTIPRYLVPCYFDVVVTGIYIQLLEQCYKLMSGFVAHGSTFVKALSLGSVQFAAYIKSADLPTLSPNIAPPKPPTRKNQNGEVVQACVTLSAGLPHFSVGYMRNWGRDTFIALRGLFILTGRYQEAREHILGYAACLRHGLIPNLLDGGRNSRFNCRDAVWWWLYCIKEYVQEAPNGVDIINDKVSRIFPTDDSPPQAPGTSADQTLAQVIQEALNVHFQGLAFRERNAGKQIDEHMTDRGFNNHIGVHPDTGFVFGGNEWNCGTWMDKMGSSDKAGNRGKPATPRDGSAIELIGLSKSVVTWLHRLHQSDKYPYNGVERKHKTGTVTRWTFREWSEKIQENFEKYFWVNAQPTPNEMQADLINKRGIYKDTFGATHAWCDYQLRCNFPIAMVAAPELFNPQHAWIALQNAEKHLLGPLGMKTLDASDWNYRGDYDNSDDSADASVAHGFNYHQGPEWVWPVGFFLRAKLLFAAQNGALKETVAATKVILSKHFVELQTSLWRGLPELTNSNGSYCRDSSRTQAWSMSCILEVLHDLQQIESRQIVVN